MPRLAGGEARRGRPNDSYEREIRNSGAAVRRNRVCYLIGQMAERPMAPDCKSGGLSPTQVRILLCPIAGVLIHFLRRVWRTGRVGKRGCSSMVEHRSSKPITRVRFPSPAWPMNRASIHRQGFANMKPGTRIRDRRADRCCSSAVERVLGKDEVLGSIPSSSSWGKIGW